MAVIPFKPRIVPEKTDEPRTQVSNQADVDLPLDQLSLVSDAPVLDLTERSLSTSLERSGGAEFGDKRALLEQRINLLVEQGGEANPWLATAYAELGHLLVAEAAQRGSHRGLLQEAEGNLLLALDVATDNGDLRARIENLEELSLVADITGNSRLSFTRRQEADALEALNQELQLMPSEERLRYDAPAVPSTLNPKEKVAFEQDIASTVREVLRAG